MKAPKVGSHVTVNDLCRVRAFCGSDGKTLFAVMAGRGYPLDFHDTGAPFARFGDALAKAESIAVKLGAALQEARNAPPPEAWLGERPPQELVTKHAPRPSNRPRRSSDYRADGALNAAGLAAKIRASRRMLGWR